MFFGNMQSFYRRNSVHNQSSKTKDQIKRVHHSTKHKTEEEVPIRRKSFTISRNPESDESAQDSHQCVPIIKINMYEPETSKKSFNILKEKEKALWYNSPEVLDDNSERLGPNKNNIIEETLEIEKRKSGDWEC